MTFELAPVCAGACNGCGETKLILARGQCLDCLQNGI